LATAGVGDRGVAEYGMPPRECAISAPPVRPFSWSFNPRFAKGVRRWPGADCPRADASVRQAVNREWTQMGWWPRRHRTRHSISECGLPRPMRFPRGVSMQSV